MNKKITLSILALTGMFLFSTAFIDYENSYIPRNSPFGTSFYWGDSTGYIVFSKGIYCQDSFKVAKDLYVGVKGGKVYMDTGRGISQFVDGNDFHINNNKSGAVYITATTTGGNVFLRANFGGQEYLIGTGTHSYSWNKTEGLFQIEIMSLDTINGLKVNQGGIGTYDNTYGFMQNANLTTTERDALTPTAGMQIYNVTTNKLQVYAGGVWTDLH